MRRAFTREELWPGTGNRESLAQAFLSRKSIIWWAISTHHPHIAFVRLRSDADVARFFDGLTK